MRFVNTVDLVGDDVLAARIVGRSISEIADDIVITIGNQSFGGCPALTEANFLAAESIGVYSFANDTALTKANFHAVTRISEGAFYNCPAMTALILRRGTVCALSNRSAFSNTPIEKGTGYIYVPAALVDSYKAATNWSTYANQFRTLEDYTVDGTVMGELDPAKIAA